MPAGMPGTTSNRTPCSCRNSASAPPRSKTNGSPHFSRATSCPRAPSRRADSRSLPARAAAARRRRRRSSRRRRRAWRSRRGCTRWSYSTTSAVVEALQPAHGDESGIARARRRSGRRSLRVTAESPSPLACARCASARMSPAPSAISCAPTRAPMRRGLVRAAARPCRGRRGCRRATTTTATSSSSSLDDRRRERADRRLAAAAERLDQRPLGVERRARRARRRSRDTRCRDGLVVVANLDRDDALSRRRHAGRRRAASARCATRSPSRRRPAAASTSAS